MTPEEFRTAGREVIDWIASYMERVEQYPVMSRVRPGEVRDLLAAHPPEHGEPFSSILDDLERIIVPGITHWQSPNFFAYFPANSSAPAILGDLLSSGLAVQGMLWSTSPACTEVETHMLDWLVEMLGLPARFASTGSGGGVIQDTASSAVLCALVAARERATQGRSNETGAPGNLTVYTSTQAHSSVEKAVRIAGLGSDQLRLIEVDDAFAMRPDSLAEALETDRANGQLPCFVCATVGTTSSMAIDPLAAIGPLCHDSGAWLHVDAAMAGTAALCPEFRSMHAGIQWADSYSFNPHKWMLTNFDCSAFYVADRAALVGALSILPEYLKNKPTESGAVIDYRDWQIPLGRRFRALKLWCVIRSYGVERLRAMVRQHVAWARELATWIEQSSSFALATPASLNLVCFYHRDGDEATRAIMDRVNASGRLFLTHTRLGERLVLRMAIGQANTTRAHVERAWDVLHETARQVEKQEDAGNPASS